jgi:hypothetical protein
MKTVDKNAVFEFLDVIRESSSINMFGAAPYIVDAFGVTRYEAKDLLLEWMQTFGQRKKESVVQV